MSDRITVMVADDDPEVRTLLGELLESDPAFELVGLAADGAEAAVLATRFAPQLAVLDAMMPHGDIEAAQAVKAAAPGCTVVFHTSDSSRRTVRRLTRAGAVDVIPKGTADDLGPRLRRAVQSAGAAGESDRDRDR